MCTKWKIAAIAIIATIMAIIIFLTLKVISIEKEQMKLEEEFRQIQQLNIQPVDINSLSKKDIEQIIVETALLNEIDSEKFLAVAKCESSLRPAVIGDDGWSIGLFQIHLPSHPDVTKERALNPIWATNWSAEKFKKNPNIWTCYRKFYGI